METRYRHGDVLLTRIGSLPDGQTIGHDGHYVLAYGEVTGHKHDLRVSQAGNLHVLKKEGVTYFCLMEVGTLVHEEHKTLEIVPGVYKMSFERELDPFLEEIRTVID